MDPKKDYYAVLGVEPPASAEELRSAWRALIEQHHPDRWTAQGKERLVQATRRIPEINEAWQALNDASRRLQYDRQRTLHLLQMVTWRPPRPRPAGVLDIDDLRHDGHLAQSPPPAPAPPWAAAVPPPAPRPRPPRPRPRQEWRWPLRVCFRRPWAWPRALPSMEWPALPALPVLPLWHLRLPGIPRPHIRRRRWQQRPVREPRMIGMPPHRTPWGPRAVALGIALAFATIVAVLLISSGVLYLVEGGNPADNSVLLTGLVATAIADAAVVLLAYRLALRRHGLGWRRGFGLRQLGRRELRYALVGVLSAWAILIVYGIAIEALGADRLLPESTLGEDVFDSVATIIAAGAISVVAAPLLEEAFFRGFVFAGLTRGGFWPAAGVSSALFSVAHWDPGSVIPFALVGVVLAWLYYRTNSLWTAVAMHFTFNLASFLVTLLADGA
ncbi:MAG: CPBP family intramembrane metalloprotease [Dehalococcoidia bacterium]|nr:CPBP family intramembrane metalloprotease [Dehalococcoidia bacterium]